MLASVLDACFPVVARRISMLKEDHPRKRVVLCSDKVSPESPFQWSRYNDGALRCILKWYRRETQPGTCYRQGCMIPLSFGSTPTWPAADVGKEGIGTEACEAFLRLVLSVYAVCLPKLPLKDMMIPLGFLNLVSFGHLTPTHSSRCLNGQLQTSEKRKTATKPMKKFPFVVCETRPSNTSPPLPL